MLEFLRKHQYGLMLVVAILTIIAFVFLYDKNTYSQGGARRGTAFKIYGKGYDSNHLQKLDSYYMLATELRMYQLGYELRGTRVVDGRPVDFPFNLLILRKEGRELGISPTNEDVQKEIESMQVFADPSTGRFDPAEFARVSELLLGRNYHNGDIIQIVKDQITLEKIKELLSANILPPATEVDDQYAVENQKITAYAIKRSLDEFLEAATATEEEIKERYEENKETLLTDEQRRIEYVHFQGPVFPKPAAFPSGNPFPGGGSPFSSEDFDLPSLLPDKKPTPPATEPAGEATTPAVPPTPIVPPSEEGGANPEPSETPAPAADPTGVPAADPADPTAATPAETGNASEESDPSAESTSPAGGADPCGAPQDEAVVDDAPSVDEPAEVGGATEPADATGADGGAAAAEPGDATGAVDDAPDAEPAAEAGSLIGAAVGAAAGEQQPAPPVSEGVGTPATGTGVVTPAAPEAPAIPVPAPAEPQLTAAEKKAISIEFAKAVKAKIDAALRVEGDVDLEALGKEFIEAAAGKRYSGAHATTELFSREDAPDFIKDARPSGQSPAPIELVFGTAQGTLSIPIKLVIDGREDWLLFRVTEVVPPTQLSLDDAREKITKELKDEKAEAALKAAITADAEKIKAEMAGQNSFKASADKLGIDYTRHYKLKGNPPPAEAGNFAAYRDLIAETVPGTFSEPKIAGDKAFVVYVAAKELDDEPGVAENKKLTIVDRLGEYGYGRQLFQAWLARAFQEADPSRSL